MHFVYILHSEKLNRFYIGYTKNLDKRLDFHLHDTQSRKFTYKADDWSLYFSIKCTTKNQALAIEKHIKAMKTKIYIQNLAKYPEIGLKLLQKYIENNSSDC
ncbi:MAG: GIY-YIG nuclease family protein [Flavobacterium sp.]|jgi:putative endonuclease|uniref:GIY-YIG nuclease family protein n=1 Tax=Flavobacterium sp. TaxID=239 RepID=UPI003BA47A82